MSTRLCNSLETPSQRLSRLSFFCRVFANSACMVAGVNELTDSQRRRKEGQRTADAVPGVGASPLSSPVVLSLLLFHAVVQVGTCFRRRDRRKAPCSRCGHRLLQREIAVLRKPSFGRVSFPQERRAFGASGWSAEYNFLSSDFEAAVFLSEIICPPVSQTPRGAAASSAEAASPLAALRRLLSEVVYGGRLIDLNDERRMAAAAQLMIPDSILWGSQPLAKKGQSLLLVVEKTDSVNPKQARVLLHACSSMARELSFAFLFAGLWANPPFGDDDEAVYKFVENAPQDAPLELLGIDGNAQLEVRVLEAQRFAEASFLLHYG